jgi:Arf-GAP/coiled-coil/ANK repeat/PH domain-containing protein
MKYACCCLRSCTNHESLTLFSSLQYVEKRFVKKLKVDLRGPTVARQMWDAVQMNKQQLALRLLITADANPNTTLEQAMGTGEPSRSPLVATIATALSRRNNSSQNSRSNWGGSLVGNHSAESATELQTAPLSPVYRAPTGNLAANEQSGTNLKDTRGCTLLHLSCQIGDLSLIELLLQHGARVNITDAQGRTPLHYCILSNRNLCAKLLLTRGSNPAATDSLGKTPLESAMEQGAITDDELFVMLSEPSG